MNLIKPAFILLFVIVILSACKKDEDDEPTGCQDGSANFPVLTLNRSLVYSFDISFYGKDTATYKVVEDMGNGKREVEVSSVKNNQSGFFQTPMYLKACGNDMYVSLDPDMSERVSMEYWEYSLDANVGDTWQTITNQTVSNFVLLSNTETITVPAGTFQNCLKVTYNQVGTFNTDTIYFHPDVHIVKYNGFMFDYELLEVN